MDTPDSIPEPIDLTAEGDRDDEGLSPMERAFVEHALDLMQQGEKHWRKKAAAAAGYKEPRNGAYRLIRRPNVIAAIGRQLAGATEAVKVDRGFVLFNAVTALEVCQAEGDYRTAARYLEIVQRHTDRTLRGDGGPNPGQAGGGALAVSLDNMDNLTTDEKRALLDLLSRAVGRPG